MLKANQKCHQFLFIDKKIDKNVKETASKRGSL